MNRRIVLVALAVLLALVGTGAVYGYAHSADKRAVANTKAASVLIVQKEIPAGTSWADVVKGNYVQQEKVPVDSAPSNAVASTAASIGSGEVTSASVAAGQVVVRPMFGDQTSVTGALAIPAQKVAVSVSLSSGADVAGFVQRNSEVAVFATYKLKAPAGSTTGSSGALGGQDLYATKLLLPRVQVIATSMAAPSDVNGAKDANGNSTRSDVIVTLALSQDEAERLILSQQVGALYLALLSDSSVTQVDGGVLGAATFQPAPIFVK